MSCQRCSVCNIGWPVDARGCANCGGKTWYSPSGDVTQVGTPYKGTTPDAIECQSCGYEVTGYSKVELARKGWEWHDANGRPFVMCDECEEEFAERRQQRALLHGVAASG